MPNINKRQVRSFNLPLLHEVFAELTRIPAEFLALLDLLRRHFDDLDAADRLFQARAQHTKLAPLLHHHRFQPPHITPHDNDV